MKARLNNYISNIKPGDTDFVRTVKYQTAIVWRLASAVKRRLFGLNLANVNEVLNLEELQTSSQIKTKTPLDNDFSKPKILLLGPYHFKQPMWTVRAKAALPDLISPLSQIAEIHWVSPIPTRDALSSILEINKAHEFHHHLLAPGYNLKSLGEKAEVLDGLVHKVRPQIIMNAFGVIASGFDVVSCAKRHGITSVLRIPGDELKASQKIKENQTVKPEADINSRKVNFAITNADHVMVMSDSEKSRVLREHPKKENVFIQIRGVDTNVFCPKENKSFQVKPLNVGFAGRLTLEKGTDILLETVEQLSKNPNILFHIVSPEIVEAERIEKYRNLKWHGYISHEAIPVFMQEMDILILPSHMEGRSQTMLEAMSCGLPVLMQKHIHPKKLLGMIHCDAEASTFVNEIKKLEHDRKYLMKLSSEARQSALEYFDKTNWTKAKIAKFKTILEAL